MTGSHIRYKNFILLTGKMGAGKDTVAGIFENYGYKRFAIADKIREIADKNTDDFWPYYIYQDIKKLIELGDITGKSRENFYREMVHCFYKNKNDRRGILQDIGSVGRMFDKYLWIKYLDNQIKPLLETREKIIISDIRHVNEFLYFTEVRQFRSIKVIKPSRQRIKGLKARDGECSIDPNKLYHTSEKEVDLITSVDYEVVNDCSLCDLETKIRKILYLSGQRKYKLCRKKTENI